MKYIISYICKVFENMFKAGLICLDRRTDLR
jgi:hypothetical protein